MPACRTLPGRTPFGGHILSHDFVEAALMRRGGWAVHMAPALGGTYEESPPSLTDYAVRDRRWCQGNLQHAGVLPARGLHWVSRLHLLTGIGSYMTAPLWLLFLLVGMLIALQAQFIRPEYFPTGASRSFRNGRRRTRCAPRGCSPAPWRCCSRRSCSAISRCCATRDDAARLRRRAARVRQRAARDRGLRR